MLSTGGKTLKPDDKHLISINILIFCLLCLNSHSSLWGLPSHKEDFLKVIKHILQLLRKYVCSLLCFPQSNQSM